MKLYNSSIHSMDMAPNGNESWPYWQELILASQDLHVASSQAPDLQKNPVLVPEH